MSEIISGHASPVGRREPRGGWVGPLLVVVVVALLASGLFSTDPELDPASLIAPIAPVGVADDPGATPVVDDQADFVEFGFDSQLGVVTPRGEPVVEVPTVHPGDAPRPARQM